MTVTELVSYAAGHFGEITIGLATTAYVIFTYHLLESAEAQQRRQVEPYLTLRWYHSRQRADKSLAQFESLAASAHQWLRETVALGRAEAPSSDQRYLILELSNARDVPLAWLQLAVTARASVGHYASWDMRDQIRVDSMSAERGSCLKVTALDLGWIPAKAAVSIRVDSLVYGPAEVGVLVDQFSGNSTYETKGRYTVSPESTEPVVGDPNVST